MAYPSVTLASPDSRSATWLQWRSEGNVGGYSTACKPEFREKTG